MAASMTPFLGVFLTKSSFSPLQEENIESAAKQPKNDDVFIQFFINKALIVTSCDCFLALLSKIVANQVGGAKSMQLLITKLGLPH